MDLRRLEWYARQLSLPFGSASGSARVARAVVRDRGIVFAGLREYDYGDDVRSIDWNATARFARPFVKTFEPDRAVDLLVLVDRSASLGDPADAWSKAALARDLAAIFILVALRQEQRMGLLLFTDRSEWSVGLHRGPRHAHKLLRALEDAGVVSRRTDLPAALREVPRLLPHPGMVLLISDFAAARYEKDLSALSRRHDIFALALVDPGEAEPPDVGLVRARDIETGRRAWIDTSSGQARERWQSAWLKREHERRELFSRAGATSLNILVGRPYFGLLKAACRSLPLRSR